MDFKKHLANLVAQADELQTAGAMRSDHDVKWQALRVGLDQAAAAAMEPAIEPAPDAVAFAELRSEVATLAGLVDLQGEKLDAIAGKVGA